MVWDSTQTRSPVLAFRSIARNQWVSTVGISFVSLHRNKHLGRRTRNPKLSPAAESWLAGLWEGKGPTPSNKLQVAVKVPSLLSVGLH